MTASGNQSPLLEISNLVVDFRSFQGFKRVVDLDHLAIYPGESFGLAGESGAGKTMTLMGILRLLPQPSGRLVSGQVYYKGREILSLPEHELQRIRGREIAVIFQDPMSSLNPVFTVGQQITDIIRWHHHLNQRAAIDHARRMLHQVRLPDAETVLRKYPHELSGGMRQRVMIAMALACGSPLLMADEPTRALDVTIQAGILDLLLELKEKSHITLLLVASHLGLIGQSCSRVGILYRGRIVELGPTAQVLRSPAHPYTAALLEAMPRISKRVERLQVSASPNNTLEMTANGCDYRNRCHMAHSLCEQRRPALVAVSPEHYVACWAADEGPQR